MRKSKYLLNLLCCFCLTLVFGQNKKIDSLKMVLSQTKNDINKAEVFNAIADEYKIFDPKITIQFANKALDLSSKIKYKLAQGNAYINLGNANLVLGNYTIALQKFSQAQTVLEKEVESNSENNSDIKNSLARAYGSIGIVFSEQSSYAKALQYQLKALKIYEQTNNQEKCARLYNNIGIIYKSQNDDFKALNYFIKCLKIQENIGDETVGTTTTNIGNIYLIQKNFSKALDYYTKAEQLFSKFPNPRGLGELNNSLGRYYMQNNNTVKAMDHFNQAIVAFNVIDDKFGISDTYYYIGEIYFEKKNWNEALVNTYKSLALAKELAITEQVQNAEKRLSEIYEIKNNTVESLKHFKLYAIAKEEVANEENIRNSVRAEMNFEFDKKKVLQKKEQEKRELLYQEESKQHKIQIFFTFLVVLLLFGIFFLIINRSQLKKTLTLQKELAEYEQKALHLQMNPHFVFNCLGSISSFIVQNGTDSAIKYLAKFSKLMRLTLEYSKESLIPIDKEVEILQNYLELEKLRFNQKFDFTISKSGEIEDDMALPPLLLQPFVENAIIHGLIPKETNGNITINFDLDKESLICTIEDNGIGFDKSQELKENLVTVHKSMALDITKKRLEMMEATTFQNAKVEIKELKDDKGEIQGTKVVLNLPIQYINRKQ